MKVLLDTDIGGDIDDALALAYLLRQPQCELLGVTTVGGQPEQRAALASAVCHCAGRPETPVQVGAAIPLQGPERQPDPYQRAALSARWPHRAFARGNTAVAFLREAIRAHPGEVTLLASGPLTNIALLFAQDPEIPTLLRGLTMVGGSFAAQTAEEEWNILCDPHAAAQVLAAPVPILSVGYDVTRHCRLDAATCRAFLARAGRPLAFVAEMLEVFFRHERPEVFFHDPLAAALLFEPTLCATRPAQIEVELSPGPQFGRTRPGAIVSPPRHRVAYSVDVARFFAHYGAVIST